MNYMKTYESHTEEQIQYLKYNNLFRKYTEKLQTDEDRFSKEGLKQSLEKIGNGEVIEKGTYGENFMYKEMLNDDSIIFIVHGNISRPILTKGYSYEIGLYKNDPRTTQIGGGYGSSGIMSIRHTRIFHYYDANVIFQNEDIISKVCKEILENELPGND